MAGPCQVWIDANDVAECCGILSGSDNDEALTAAADAASATLFDLSGSRYTGTCERVVRPVGDDFCWAPRMHRLDTRRLSQVKLAGYVTSIVEVLIDGAPIDPAGYRIDDHRYLTRMAAPDGAPQRWPANPRLDLPASGPGTFQITYQHGLQPPGIGIGAAATLACEFYKASPAPTDGNLGECKLPAGAKRIVRQGVTIELVSALASMLKRGATGLTDVDAFLAVYGRQGRASALYSPDIRPFARPEGISSGS
jgi:hypothetical protein